MNDYTAMVVIVLGFLAFLNVVLITGCWVLVALMRAMLESIKGGDVN